MHTFFFVCKAKYIFHNILNVVIGRLRGSSDVYPTDTVWVCGLLLVRHRLQWQPVRQTGRARGLHGRSGVPGLDRERCCQVWLTERFYLSCPETLTSKPGQIKGKTWVDRQPPPPPPPTALGMTHCTSCDSRQDTGRTVESYFKLSVSIAT